MPLLSMFIDSWIDVRKVSNFLGCAESFLPKVDFVKHLTNRHNIVCSVESYTFESELKRNWKVPKLERKRRGEKFSVF